MATLPKLPRGSGEALEHVFYEIEMLLACHAALCTEKFRDVFEGNLYLEGCILHARNLEEFYWDSKEGGGDMKASHFGIVSSNDGRHPDIGRFNTEVCHLTYRRKKTLAEGGWAISLTLEPLVSESQRFVEFVQAKPDLMSWKHNAEQSGRILDKINSGLWLVAKTANNVQSAAQVMDILERQGGLSSSSVETTSFPSAKSLLPRTPWPVVTRGLDLPDTTDIRNDDKQ